MPPPNVYEPAWDAEQDQGPFRWRRARVGRQEILVVLRGRPTLRTIDGERETVDNWLDPGNVSWLQQYEREVILNIANEWGPAWSSTNHVWRDSYITQVQRLRNEFSVYAVDTGYADGHG